MAEKAKGVESERIREISALHPEDLEKLIKEVESAEDSPSEPPQSRC